MMKAYSVKYTEFKIITNEGNIVIEAETEEEALRIIKKRFANKIGLYDFNLVNVTDLGDAMERRIAICIDEIRRESHAMVGTELANEMRKLGYAVRLWRSPDIWCVEKKRW